jgi:hypothetical protein
MELVYDAPLAANDRPFKQTLRDAGSKEGFKIMQDLIVGHVTTDLNLSEGPSLVRTSMSAGAFVIGYDVPFIFLATYKYKTTL